MGNDAIAACMYPVNSGSGEDESVNGPATQVFSCDEVEVSRTTNIPMRCSDADQRFAGCTMPRARQEGQKSGTEGRETQQSRLSRYVTTMSKAVHKNLKALVRNINWRAKF